MLKKRALALTAVLALGLIPTLPSYAVTTYASPADLIEDVVEVALTGVTSPTKGDALTEMKGKITLTGDEVFYDGTSIGYWYSEDSSTIYTTEAQADTVVVSDGSNGWEVEPIIFEDILSDVNEDLVENVVPTTADWSKIIGKYDVTLGTVTIPAEQWIPIETNGIDYYNVTKNMGYSPKDDAYTNKVITVMPYVIDASGNLYLSLGMYLFSRSPSAVPMYVHEYGSTAEKVNHGNYAAGGHVFNPTTEPFMTLTLNTSDSKIQMWPGFYETSTLATGYVAYTTSEDKEPAYALHAVDDETQVYTGDFSDCETGVVIVTYDKFGMGNTYTTAWLNEYHNKMFTSQSSSKKVVGNTTLTKRLAKLSNLAASDTIVFTASGWTVNGLEDLDSYISTSILTEAGQSATMDGAVEIEELNFKVVVPSTLPMIADSEGNVQVASNASIDNKSNAKVKITGLEIEANSESGWTMVDSNPSKTRGANEFSFGTSLSIGDEIAKGDELEFTYNADLSPAEQGVDSVDLVTLTITLDWAE